MNGLRTLLSALAVLTLAASAQAQRSATPPVELGVDAAVTIDFDPTVTTVSIPVSQIRAGFFATPSLEFEPRFGLISVSGDGGHFTRFQLDLGMLYHFSPSRAVAQTYLRPFAGVVATSGGGDRATPSIGIGLGAKLPMGSRFAFRPELNYSHAFEHGRAPARDALQFLFGLSVYSH